MQDTLILAIRIGLKIEEYWDLTPSEFCCYLKAFEHKELDLLNKNITLSWYTEYFARQKKLDKVTKYLIKDTKNNKKITKNNKKMSEEEIEKHYKSKVVK